MKNTCKGGKEDKKQLLPQLNINPQYNLQTVLRKKITYYITGIMDIKQKLMELEHKVQLHYQQKIQFQKLKLMVLIIFIKKKFMKYFFITIAIFFFSCSNNTDNNSKLNSGDDTLRQKLIGFWGGMNEDRPVYEFRGDSIYYCEDKRQYYYSLAHDSVIVYYDSSKFIWSNAHIIGDTFFYYPSKEMLTKAYRFKSKP